MYHSKYHQIIKSFLKKDLPSELWGNPYIMVCDCETTGFSDKKHELISFSASIHDYDLDKKEEITVYARPKPISWTKKAQEIHGFTLENALAFPHPRKTAIEILHFLKPFKTDDNKPLLFVSHDTSGFDRRFVKSFFMNQMLINSYWKVFKDEFCLSTINMARNIGIKENKLNIWANKLGKELKHHEAESDRNMCFEVFKHILDTTGGQQELGVKNEQ